MDEKVSTRDRLRDAADEMVRLCQNAAREVYVWRKHGEYHIEALEQELKAENARLREVLQMIADLNHVNGVEQLAREALEETQ